MKHVVDLEHFQDTSVDDKCHCEAGIFSNFSLIPYPIQHFIPFVIHPEAMCKRREKGKVKNERMN